MSDLATRPDASATAAAETAPLLRVQDVYLSFGSLAVLQGVSLEVKRGEIVGLIGPNGAGKTTLFDVISGFREQARGKVWKDDVDLLTRKAWERPWLGVGRTFQQVTLYRNLTVRDCIRLSLHRRTRNQPVRALLAGMFGTRRSAEEERYIDERTDIVIERLGLGDYSRKLASDLSYGTLRMAELACVLALEPEIVLLDEPASGIAQAETEALGPLLLELREELGATFLLIEHDMPLVMSISDRIYALANGGILAEGSPDEVQSNHAVVESYLGGSFDLAEEVEHHEHEHDHERGHEQTVIVPAAERPRGAAAANGGSRRRQPLRADGRKS